ncbi:MAG: three-Cys-motif partner protein TcmP [Opitutales bacterium]|nr:three-Cys-motif partner protein TcmP [Opitutales bacterium]
MPRAEIDDKPFNEATLTKLELFERYAREWLPVFLSEHSRFTEINICDFFCGSGTDSNGTAGSALRMLAVIREFDSLISARQARVRVFCSDKLEAKICRLREHISARQLGNVPAEIILKAVPFTERFEQLRSQLYRDEAANLLIVDQYGVQHFESTFDALIDCPTTDVLAFVSSSWFQRFHSLPEVKRYLVDRRPDAYHLAHRAVLEAYRKRLPADRKYYLGEFSLKSGSNIYGVVFGSGHPLGMAKFLRSAWKLDNVNGSANYDVEREGIHGESNFLFDFAGKPKKVEVFEESLEAAICSGRIRDELQILEVCFEHGVTPQHATPVLQKLKKTGDVCMTWRVPDARNHGYPRPLHSPS